MTLPLAGSLDNAGGAGSNGGDRHPRSPSHTGDDVFTVGHLIDSFSNHLRILIRAGVNKPKTLTWHESQFKHLAPLRGIPADSLRTHHLSAIKLTNAFTRVLKRLYKWAADEDLVPRDPFRKLAVPPCGERTRVLTRSELRLLYRACSRALRRLLFVQLRTLARPGEIRELVWAQVNFERRAILLGDFKAKKKRRDKLRFRAIPLPMPVMRLLRNLQRKAKDKSPEGRVFASPRYGRPWTYNAVRCAMRVARKRAGLDGDEERVVCYTLRHTGATNAIRGENGGEPMALKVLSEVLGHTRTTTTERYLHLDTTDLLEAIDRAAARTRKPRAN
jgi:integrase